MKSRHQTYRYRPRTLACPFTSCGCRRLFSDHSGLTRHVNAAHPRPPQAAAASSSLDCENSDSPTGPALDPDRSPSPAHTSRRSSPPTDIAVQDDLSGHELRHHMLPESEARQHLLRVEHHPLMNGMPCDKDGHFVAKGSPAGPHLSRNPDDYYPFESRQQYETGDFLYRRAEMSGGKIDDLMHLWASSLPDEHEPPFANHNHLYATIDAIPLGDVPWDGFSITYNGPIPDGPMPSWMVRSYDAWFRDPHIVMRNQLANPDFTEYIDWGPQRRYGKDGKRQYSNLMTGDWAWSQADLIAQDETLYGTAFCPIILGSDKTTVSVATGQNEYYPLYASNGCVTNSARRAHRNAITLIGFLAIPKTERQYQNDSTFRRFRRELFHASLRFILASLRPYMTTFDIVQCGDGHYRRVVYGLGPYIADYPEQVLLSCVVQGWCPRCTAPATDLDTGQALRRSHKHTEALANAFDLKTLWEDYGIVGDIRPFTADFPRADIHELLSPDLLHQVIKGSFKDHLVCWVEEYLVLTHGKAGAAIRMADIDRRIAAAPSFPGLRRFPEGRGFKQWTGDDSKALMKVYLPAITGHVPAQMVRALSAFLDFCYFARRDTIDEDTLQALDDALERFHRERVIFETTGVRLGGISLPRQHSLKHYHRLIRLFASPNGLCSSMMEAKHITAVKHPYRRSSRNQPLGQIIQINQRLDKLTALRVDFATRGMLQGPCPRLPRLLTALDDHDAVDGNGDFNLTNRVTPSTQPLQCRQSSAAQQYLVLGADEEDSDEDTGGDALQAGAHNSDHGEDQADNAVACAGAVFDPSVLAECLLCKTPVRGYPKQPAQLAEAVSVPELPDLIRRFLYDQLSPGSALRSCDVPLSTCPVFESEITVYPSAVATFYAPSDPSGPRGMHRERIRSVASWRNGGPRRDCVFVAQDADLPGFRGLHVARVRLFFSFRFQGLLYPCALVAWFSAEHDAPDPDTGMWVVTPDLDNHRQPVMDVIHLDTIVRAAHLIGVAGDEFIPSSFEVGPEDSLDIFRRFYVNKYADHHSHEIAF
ncbi:hypothetical protein BD414DRAFT_468489 [Trametes punicea]|nr:hypothetical protein BD414DRAFT_468489 [Trametes punicea]